MRVNVCLPHYIQEQVDPAANPNGYGSLRKKAMLKRSLAMGHCINVFLNLPQLGFVSPLETAAKLMVLQNFPVMKPNLKNWTFLLIEHGHPSFLHYLNKLPLNSMSALPS